MTLAPTYGAIKRETSRKPMFLGKKTADSWALDKSVRMVYYLLEMYSIVHWDNEGVPLYYVFV
jgi:hypothetical protein